MNCYDSALIGVGLLGASVYTSFVPDNEVHKLKNILSGDDIEAYKRINNERFSLYFQGLIIGFIIVVLVNFLYGENISNPYHKTTLFLLIILGFSLFYYLLSPKSDYMLNHINSEKENKAWLDVYLTMKNRYLWGFVFGALASIPLSNSLCYM